MKTVLVIRHVAFEDLGSFVAVLDSTGYRVEWHEAGMSPLRREAAAQADLVVILGGPIGVYEQADYPFLADEIDLARERMDADAPTLGICLGSQIMAAALGSTVYPGAQGKEIGWSPIALTDQGASGPLAELHASRTQVLHWHGDTFDLPPKAKLLASTERYQNQAFSVGKRGLALQFHPEVTAAGLERWFVGHTLEIATTPGLSVAKLRDQSAAAAASLAECGPKFFAAWLGAVSS
ncbi:glutamine amidotransferase [Bradyrhizobium cenepequi]